MSAHRIVARLRDSQIDAAAVFGNIPADSSGLIAINAWRLSDAVHAFRASHPTRPIIVVLAGSDLYQSKTELESQQTLLTMSEATALVVAQAEALESIPDELRGKCKIIPKSVDLPATCQPKSDDDNGFEAIVVSNLRPEKDPLLAAEAALSLPGDSELRVTHYGIELDRELAEKARAAASLPNSRYRWLGSASHGQTLQVISSADLFINSSIFEGGANAVCEAIALGTPVLATRIPGNVGILGADYPGLYPAGDALALKALLLRCERCPEFVENLKMHCAKIAPTFLPESESRLWANLIHDLVAQESLAGCSPA